jgi:sigma-B regulation protein RsbU (phosphoserine phosphatase)
MESAAAPIIVFDPDIGVARQVAEWLRSAGLGRISTARTADEAIFLLGRQSAALLIIDEALPLTAEMRVLRHLAAGGHGAPPIVRLIAEDSSDPLAMGRPMAAEAAQKPLDALDLVIRVGCAMQRPDLAGQMDRRRDHAAAQVAAASRMQVGLLPTAGQIKELQAAGTVGVAGFLRSGEAVGGDFWGAWPTGRGRLAVALADFAGHGLSAALNTFRLHAMLTERRLPRGMPTRMMSILNRRLCSMLPCGQYATMIYAQIDPIGHRVVWCSAGGPPPLFVTTGGARALEARGLPLGVRPNAIYRRSYASLRGAGILCLFSDGLYEGGARSEEVPQRAIVAALAPAASLANAGHLPEAADLGIRELAALRDRYACIDHSDDVTAVCIAFAPSA